MPLDLRRRFPLRRIWAGLGLLAAAVGLSLGGVNAWQLENRGIPVSGRQLDDVTVSVRSCSRDIATLWQSYVCDVEYPRTTGYVVLETQSMELLTGRVLVQAWTGGGRWGDITVVPPGTRYNTDDWQPTDTALVGWLALIVLAPLVMAIGGGMRRTEPTGTNPFDEMAKSWDDDPVRLERAHRVASQIIAATTPGGEWLDYGAGTGALGIALLGHAEAVVLADSSAGMCEASRAKVAEQGLGDVVDVVQLDLAVQDATPEVFEGVASVQALHHIADARAVVEKLATMVRPGGWLALCDLDAEDGSFHAPGHGHGGVHAAHHGFDRAEVGAWMSAAGLVDLTYATPWVNQKGGRDYPLFLVVGHKPE